MIGVSALGSILPDDRSDLRSDLDSSTRSTFNNLLLYLYTSKSTLQIMSPNCPNLTTTICSIDLFLLCSPPCDFNLNSHSISSAIVVSPQ